MGMLRLASLCVAFALGSGCGILPYDIEERIPDQHVPASPVSGPLTELFPPILLDRGLGGGVKHAFLKTLDLTATPHDQPSGTFDLLDEARVFVDAPSDARLRKVEIAHLAPVTRGATRIRLDVVPDIDLLPYLGPGARIASQGSGRLAAVAFTFDGQITITITI